MDAPMWTSVDEVMLELGPVQAPYSPDETRRVERAVLVAHTQVCRWRPDLDVSCTDADVRAGATKLAALMCTRRGASGGQFAEFDDMTAPTMPGVIDAEIQALIGIGRHHGPVVA